MQREVETLRCSLPFMPARRQTASSGTLRTRSFKPQMTKGLRSWETGYCSSCKWRMLSWEATAVVSLWEKSSLVTPLNWCLQVSEWESTEGGKLKDGGRGKWRDGGREREGGGWK